MRRWAASHMVTVLVVRRPTVGTQLDCLPRKGRLAVATALQHLDLAISAGQGPVKRLLQPSGIIIQSMQLHTWPWPSPCSEAAAQPLL